MTRKHLSGRPTYDIIRINIQRAVAKGFFVTIRLNLTRKNQDISEFVNEINSMNLKRNRYRVHITNAHQFDNSASLNDFYFRSAEEYSKAFDTVQNVFVTNGYKFLRNYPRSYGCEFDKANTFLVSSDLNLYFCTSCELTESFHQGYIRKDGALCLNENYLKREAYSPFNDFECRNCLMLPMCLGGCTYCRIKNKKFCISEKHFINRFVEKLYCESRSIAEIST